MLDSLHKVGDRREAKAQCLSHLLGSGLATVAGAASGGNRQTSMNSFLPQVRHDCVEPVVELEQLDALLKSSPQIILGTATCPGSRQNTFLNGRPIQQLVEANAQCLRQPVKIGESRARARFPVSIRCNID